MSQFIQVCEDDDTMDSIEIPSEDDGSLLLTTIAAQFPGACGLKYKSESGIFRGIRFADGVLFAPEGVWGSNQYFVVFPKTEKRKGDDGCFGNPASKLKRTTSDNSKCTDLIVLGLPWKSGEDDLRNYFSQFGDLVLVQVKRDLRTGQSKGFGFIRFCTMDAQIKCMSQRHMIDGRWCDVTIPNSKESGSRLNQSDNWQQLLASSNNEALNNAVNKKIFVGRCTENISTEDLRCYFSKFGEVVDVFIPKPFRAFAFVTFTDADLAQSLYGDDHIIKGTSVHISNASPKSYDKSGGPKSNFGSFGQQGGYSSQGSISSSVAGLSLPKASLYEHLPYSNPAYGYGTPSPTLPAARTGLEYQEVPTAYSSSTAFQPSHSSAYLTGLVSATQFDALQEQAYQAGNNLQYHDVSNSAYQNALSSLYESQGSVYQTGQASVFQTGQGSAYQLPQTEYAANGTVPDAGSGASYHQNYARSAGEYMY